MISLTKIHYHISLQSAELYFVIATTACVLVIMSLVHFLMALSANYAHIRGHDKFTDFVDLQNIDMTSESVQLTEVNSHAHDPNKIRMLNCAKI